MNNQPTHIHSEFNAERGSLMDGAFQAGIWAERQRWYRLMLEWSQNDGTNFEQYVQKTYKGEENG